MFAGSLKSHWMKYITNIDLQVNPTDTVGTSMAGYMSRTVHQIPSKFVQPGFKFKSAFNQDCGYYAPSTMHLTFVNGYERQYNMAVSPFKNIEFELK